MINITIREHGIHMEGHAAREQDGRNPACNAVSALTCGLVNSLTQLAGEKIEQKHASGKFEITWEQLSDKGKLLVDSWFLGVEAVNQNYGCIQYL